MDNSTIEYYNQHVKQFVSTTVDVDFKEKQDKFINKLPGKNVLDFGCGSGRDTKYFLKSGLNVTAIDGSSEMCRAASEYAGILVRKMLFEECRKANPNSLFISEVEEITEPLPDGVKRVGVCGATSTPKWLMEMVADRIRELNAK